MNKRKCKCNHNKDSHHLINGERTWCYKCECIEYNTKEYLKQHPKTKDEKSLGGKNDKTKN